MIDTFGTLWILATNFTTQYYGASVFIEGESSRFVVKIYKENEVSAFIIGLYVNDGLESVGTITNFA